MIAVLKRQARAAEYRRLAIAAGALAEASPLDHVREKHARAAARWAALADLDERPIALPPAGARSQRPPVPTSNPLQFDEAASCIR